MLAKRFLLALQCTALVSAFALRQTSSSSCPYNYPVNLTNTESHNGLIFTIASNNAVTNNRAVQLRSVPPTYGGPNVQVAAIDTTSPVLLGQYRNGVIYSEARNNTNQLYDLGPTAGLSLVAEDGSVGPNVSRWALEFEKTKSSDDAFYLLAPSSDGTYGVYHRVPDEFVNGFILCPMDKSTWYQLYYQSYYQTPPNRPGCEDVGVRTTVGATIYNGACDIGGYKA